jgi:hypothetical protein
MIGERVVETYVAVPDDPAPFAINLKSKGWIAPGLAMFVCKFDCSLLRQYALQRSKTLVQLYRSVDLRPEASSYWSP